MIEKPPCFGSPCLAARSPCHGCGVLAACARRLTQTGAFGLLMWPRLPAREADRPAGTPAPLLVDPAILAGVHAALESRAGLVHVRGRGVWKWRREDVLAVREASAAAVVIEFFDVPPGRLAEMRAVSLGVQIGSVYSGGPRSSAPTVGRWASGSTVASADWRPATEVAVEAVASVYHDREAER